MYIRLFHLIRVITAWKEASAGVIWKAVSSRIVTVNPMDDRAICLPWNKNFGLAPLGQAVVYRELLKFTREYGDILVCQYPWDKH